MTDDYNPTTDLAVGVNTGFAVIIDALIRSGAVSPHEVLAALQRENDRPIAQGPITEALLHGIEVSASSHIDDPEPSDNRWKPQIVKSEGDR